MKKGVIIDCFGKDFASSAAVASEMGFDGIQIHLAGELAPSRVTPEIIKSRRETAEKYGLEIVSCVGDAGGFGFVDPKDAPGKVELTKRKLDVAKELGASIVTAHIGVIPDDFTSDAFFSMRDSLNGIGKYAESVGLRYAIETGPEPAERLRRFLDALDTDGVGVNLDPANLVMVTDYDPAKAVRILGQSIFHTHVKDGRLIKKTDPKVIYDYFAVGGIEDIRLSDYFIETPLGEGDVDFDCYFSALKEIGYDGYLTVERETGSDPKADIQKAIDFINEKLF